MNYLGDKLRTLRESQGLLLRQAAAFLEVDTAFISKVERGEKKATKEQVIKLSKFLNISEEKLIELWLADKVMNALQGDTNSANAISLVSKQIKKK